MALRNSTRQNIVAPAVFVGKESQLSRVALNPNRFHQSNKENVQKAMLKDIENRGVPVICKEDPQALKSKRAPSKIPSLIPRKVDGIQRVDALISKKPVPSKPIRTSSSLVSKALVSKETSKLVKHVNIESTSDNCSSFSSLLIKGAIKDVDANDGGDPQLVSEYVNDIYQHLSNLENENQVQKNFLHGQAVTPWMRSILVDWLIQVGVRFNLLQETLYLTVAILDRYLQLEKNTSREDLQLVGITAMMVACKYEETYIPDINDFLYITDNAYSKRDIRLMEVKVLKTLGCYVSFPIGLTFLRRFSKAGCVTSVQHTTAKYLMELCLTEYHMAHYKASLVAAAALNLSIKLLGANDQDRLWTETLVFYSSYKEEQLLPIVCRLAAIVDRSHTYKLKSVMEKYASTKLMKISQCPHLKSNLIKIYASKVA